MPLGSDLKKKTEIAKKQYQRLDKVYEFDKQDDNKTINKKPTIKKYDRSNLIYSYKHNFYKYHDIKKINSLSFEFKIFIFKQVLLGFK